jgi:hypothetical protein
MLMLGLYAAVIVLLLAVEAIYVRKLSERLERAEKEIASWKLATEHLQRELEKHW